MEQKRVSLKSQVGLFPFQYWNVWNGTTGMSQHGFLNHGCGIAATGKEGGTVSREVTCPASGLERLWWNSSEGKGYALFAHARLLSWKHFLFSPQASIWLHNHRTGNPRLRTKYIVPPSETTKLDCVVLNASLASEWLVGSTQGFSCGLFSTWVTVAPLQQLLLHLYQMDGSREEKKSDGSRHGTA